MHEANKKYGEIKMSIQWPPSLIEDIARGRCIFFLGAGVSASAETPAPERRKPKTWGEFLSSINNRFINDVSEKNFINNIIDQKQFLLALQCIYDLVDKGTYHHIIEEEFSNPDYQPSKVHELIYDIDPKIVITTNFDFIYEKTIPRQAFTKVIYNNCNNYSDAIRSNKRVLVYAHGNVDSIGDIVFTKEQYFNAKRAYPEFFSITQGLFMTNTVLFLGCGLNDPDINLLLENVYIRTSSTKPHYNITLEGVHNSVKRDWKCSYNIETLEYGPTYDDLIGELQELKNVVESYKNSYGIGKI